MIVFCHLLNDRSGSPTVLRDTLNALNARTNGLLYVGSQGRGVLEEAAVPTRRYWYRRSRYRILTMLSFFVSQFALYRALARVRDIPADAIIFVNTLLPFGAMIWGARSGRRVVVHVHEVSITPGPLRIFLTRCAARYADQLLYVSKDHLSRLPISGPPAEVLYNPVNQSLREEAKVVRYLPRRSGAFEVLMLASLRGYKGIEEFMCLARAMQDRPDICFSLVLNAEIEEVEVFQNRYSDSQNITLHPRTDRPSVFYARADLVLNLSRTDQWIETFGLTIVEAMTFGVPVIAPPVGGPAEIVTHGKEGFCIDSRDGAALQTAILKLADNPDLAIMMSNAARSRANDFTFEAFAKGLHHIITNVQ